MPSEDQRRQIRVLSERRGILAKQVFKTLTVQDLIVLLAKIKEIEDQIAALKAS